MRLDTHILGKALKDRGFAFYCGVPCSFLSDLINYTINEAELVMSSNEGDAVAAAAGAYLAGKKAVVFMQNSGLTNAISPLTSLNHPFRIPVLGFVSLRGEPGLGDEPQHELMGTITEKMLDLVKVKWEYLAADIEEARDQLDRADRAVEKGKPFFFVVRKGSLGRVVLKKRARKFNGNKVLHLKAAPPQQFRRFEVLEALHRTRSGDTVLLASTGKIGRELYEVGDVPGNLYMVGSMGSVSSLGLGMALNSKKPIIAIDGDGALLMRMGNLAVNGCYAPRNLLHLLIDNNAHDSTGGTIHRFPQRGFCLHRRGLRIHQQPLHPLP